MCFTSINKMFYTEDNGDKVRQFRPLFKILRFLSLAPNYDFDKKKSKSSNFLNLLRFLITLSVCILLWQSIPFYLQNGNNFNNKINEIILLFSGSSQIFLVIFINYIIWQKKNLWDDFVRSLFDIEIAYSKIAKKINSVNNKQRLIIFNRVFILISFIVVPLTILIYDNIYFHYYSEDIPNGFLLCLFILWIYSIYHLLFIFLICTIIIFYKRIINNLKSVIAANNYSITCLKIIFTCRQVYLKCANSIHLFNKLFGYQILIIVVISYLQCVIFAYHEYTKQEIPESKTDLKYMEWSTICYMVFILVIFFILTFCCDLVDKSVERLLVECINSQNLFKISSDEYQEFEDFINIISRRKIIFHAAHFIELNRAIPFTLFFNVTSFFIALIQFH